MNAEVSRDWQLLDQWEDVWPYNNVTNSVEEHGVCGTNNAASDDLRRCVEVEVYSEHEEKDERKGKKKEQTMTRIGSG